LRRTLRRLTAGVALFLALVVPVGAAAAGLSPAEARGKQIYRHGTSEAGREITAYIGAASIPIPASATPCAACHGDDGRGLPEGGVVPSDITWSRLSKPYGATSPGGRRRHPAYDAATLQRAVLAGVDPGDNRLDPSMPRYTMAAEDLDDLVAYIQRLEADLDPGIGHDRLVVGTVMPRAGPMAAAGEAMTRVLSAYFGDLNGEGGIFNRRLELLVAHADTPGQALERARQLIDETEVYALLGPMSAGIDRELAELAEERRVPLIAPFTAEAPADTGLRRYTFYLLPGPEIQGRALVEFATGRIPITEIRAAILFWDDDDGLRLAKAMRDYALEKGWPNVSMQAYARGALETESVAAELQGRGVQAVFFLGDGAEFQAFAGAAARAAWAPYLFVRGPTVGRAVLDAPASFGGLVFVAYPAAPQDRTREAVQAFQAFQGRHQLPREHGSAQVSAYIAAGVFVDALKEAGRALSREKLVSALEGFYRHATGLTPPLTYGPNRRVGAQGAYVVSVDLKNRRFAASGAWVEPESPNPAP
jgi:ABC-type branched-subunit amino acid transport system substrate-binding protein